MFEKPKIYNQKTEEQADTHFLSDKYTNSVIRKEITQYLQGLAKQSSAEKMPQLEILCGKNGGLPFDHIMTDVISGCLPQKNICYGNCTAAEYWINTGYDFGSRVENIFDEGLFRESIMNLPNEQKWLR